MHRDGGGSRHAPGAGTEAEAGVLLRTALDLLPDAAVVCRRADGAVLAGNALAAALLGLLGDEEAGAELALLGDECARASLLEQLDREETATGPERAVLRPDGSEIRVSTSNRAILFEGQPAVLTILHDVTAGGGREAEAARQGEALTAISRLMSGARLGRRTYARFAEAVGELIHMDGLAVSVIEGAPGSITCVFAQGIVPPGHEEGLAMALGASLEARAVSASTGQLGSAGRARPAAPARDAGLRWLLAAPLVASGRVLGVLSAGSCRDIAYTTRDLELLESAAAHLASAMERARLYGALEQEASEREVLAAIGRVVSASPDISNVPPRFAALVGALVPMDRMLISALSEDGLSLVSLCHAGIALEGRDTPGAVVPAARSLTEAVTRDPRSMVLHAADLSDVVARSPQLVRAYKAGLRSFIAVPLSNSDDAVAVLHVQSKQPGAYAPRHRFLAESISAQIAGVVAASRLRAAERRAEKERRAIAEIAIASNRDLDLPRVFERAADALVKIIPYDRMEVTLLERDGGPPQLAFARGLSPEELQAGGAPAPASRERDGEAWAPVLVPGRTGTDGGGDRLSAMVQAPLGTRPRYLGCLRLFNRTPEAYTAHTVELVEQAATYLSSPVQNALEHGQAMELAREREQLARLDAEHRHLQSVSEAKSQFLTTVSHELKTPLTTLVAFTDILLRNRNDRLRERELTQLEVMKRSGRRLGLLIDDLLDLSRLDGGTFKLGHSAFDAGELVREVAVALGPILAERGQALDVSVPRRELWIRADRDRLAQVLSNLLSNASKYSTADGRITLTARRRQDRLYVSVRDSGVGISARDRRQLFTLFFRADNEATRSVPGTGLGLYIVKSIISLHGGDISVRSKVGEGTTVQWFVPGLLAGPPAIAAAEEPRGIDSMVRSRLDSFPEQLAS
ncbi:MAG: ATP-binding protein [Dehalococcoidia bacterium]